MAYSYQHFAAVNTHPQHTTAVVTVEASTGSSTSVSETSAGGDQFLGRIWIPSDGGEVGLGFGGFREKAWR